MAFAPSDAYYRFTVTNIGNVDLENVVVNDDTLGITNYAVGSLAMGASVVISHDDSGDMMLADLFVANLCESEMQIPNTATAGGKSADSTETVQAEDSALFECQVPVNICEEFGRPNDLQMTYNGTPESNNTQDSAYTVEEVGVPLPAVASRVEIHSCNKAKPCDSLEDTIQNVAIDSDIVIKGSLTTAGKLLPNITLKIFNGDDLAQSIWFHGSCSEPLAVGDKHGGFTISGYSF
jgi:hypothetical protein